MAEMEVHLWLHEDVPYKVLKVVDRNELLHIINNHAIAPL
jgi:hypothetical protein